MTKRIEEIFRKRLLRKKLSIILLNIIQEKNIDNEILKLELLYKNR